MAPLEMIGQRRARIVEACERAGRDPVTFSLWATTVIGTDRADVERRQAAAVARRGAPVDASLAATWLVGTVEDAARRLREYEAAGVQRVYLQHLDHRDLDAVALIGR